jgi:hypothetical protein
MEKKGKREEMGRGTKTGGKEIGRGKKIVQEENYERTIKKKPME